MLQRCVLTYAPDEAGGHDVRQVHQSGVIRPPTAAEHVSEHGQVASSLTVWQLSQIQAELHVLLLGESLLPGASLWVNACGALVLLPQALADLLMLQLVGGDVAQLAHLQVGVLSSKHKRMPLVCDL